MVVSLGFGPAPPGAAVWGAAFSTGVPPRARHDLARLREVHSAARLPRVTPLGPKPSRNPAMPAPLAELSPWLRLDAGRPVQARMEPVSDGLAGLPGDPVLQDVRGP